MLVIKIKSGTAQAREIQTKNGRKEIAEQVGFIEHDDEVRKVRIPIRIDEGQAPYPPGSYTLAASSFTVGKFHDIEINRYELALQPIAAEARKAG